ncbi:hypothetical protein LCGC14_1673020 [marine sediment metagenome]|uniref:Uncharacterized protein n=1 Tax=marine sediment metagenome TaxID=412755 RepID=A0A0F9ID70_9ZZZZ
MTEPWAIDLKESARDFLETVYPKIKDWFGDGELIPVELVTKSDMAKKLDMYAGIDNWYIVTDKGIRGLSSRVQYDKDWGTFTVRRQRLPLGTRTEYAKLLHAIENDYLYPYWTFQSYLNKREKDLDYGERKDLLNAAMCKTKDLISYIKSGERGKDFDIREVTTRGAANFFTVWWGDLRERHEVKIYDKNNIQKMKKRKT